LPQIAQIHTDYLLRKFLLLTESYKHRKKTIRVNLCTELVEVSVANPFFADGKIKKAQNQLAFFLCFRASPERSGQDVAIFFCRRQNIKISCCIRVNLCNLWQTFFAAGKL
jgi:hypothetical protein